MTAVETARHLLAHGRPRAAARLLLADGSAAARALLDALPAEAPHGAVLAERLRFGPPETWRGWRPGFGAVAVKLWPAGLASSPLVPVNHAGVARLVDQGAGWRLFAWVPGETLARASVTAEAVAQVETALAALHRAGQAHGDLTPANVALGPRGAVLIDWGEHSAGTPGWRPDRPHDLFARDRFALERLRASAFPCPPPRIV